MKQTFIITFVAIALLCSCKSHNASPNTTLSTPTTELQKVSTNINGLNISFDKRMEMLEVIQYLSGSFLVNSQDIIYKQRIEEYFKDFKEHPAVKTYKKMEGRGFSYNVPPTALLSVDDNFNFIQEIDEYYVIRLSGGMGKLKKWYSMLQDFDKESDFNKFMNESAEIFQKSLNVLMDSSFTRRDQIEILERFYGYGQNSYNIILTPLSIGGYGPRVQVENDIYDVYDIQGPWGKPIDGITNFGNERQFIEIIWHEFSHSFVNPLYYKYNDDFMKYASLYEPIAEQMEKNAYPTWDITVYEHIVRAITAYLITKNYGEELGREALEKDKSHGFLYLDGVYAAIERYDANRETPDGWEKFSDFFPELIKVFEQYYNEQTSAQ